eukprot:TRINITY_DN2685_c0_g1_i1.p1 TRINITY_DN2685_c0_g1~~TRINITY_DN2685_c0_g1_i1.p1  ORF type:complete len:429 (+),score=81.02 TRINITY_DN2685_c0_g1_i1:40-1326(+)
MPYFDLKKKAKTIFSDVFSKLESNFLIVFIFIELRRFFEHFGSVDRCDWDCYMLHGLNFLKGQWDYTKIECPLGPAYYPAANVVFYGVFALLTDWSYAKAQIFGGLAHIMSHWYVVKIGEKCGLSKLVSLLCVSFFSFHSWHLAIAKVTNDVYSNLLVILCVYFCTERKFFRASTCYTLSVGMKMNNLFFGPALLIYYLVSMPFFKVVLQFGWMGILQVVTALPFLYANFWGYIGTAFNFSRKFTYNNNFYWRLLPRSIVEADLFGNVLLLLTIVLLVRLFVKITPKVKQSSQKLIAKNASKLDYQYIVLIFLMSNAIGYACSRGIHIQFMIWYYWSVPILCYCCSFPTALTLFTCYIYDACYRGPENILLSVFVHPFSFKIANQVILLLTHFVTIFLLFKRISVPYEDLNALIVDDENKLSKEKKLE